MKGLVIESSTHNDELRESFWMAYLASSTRGAIDAFLVTLFGRKRQ